MRVRKKPWTEKELNTNPHFIKESEKYRGKWKEYFGNSSPLYVEIGCGKGQFLSRNAVAYPDINFIGVERQETVIAVAARKLGEAIKNAALIPCDVEQLKEYFAPGEIQRLYINFCDPWPRKKWAKRRLTYRGFLEEYKALFGEKGEIFFKTDNQGLFEFSLNEFCSNGWELSQITFDLHNSEYQNNIMTEYEERFSQQGLPIYRLEARWEKGN